MKTRHILISGIASIGLVLAAPVQAEPDFMDGSFIVVKRDQGNDVRQDSQDTGKDKRSASRKPAAEREEPQGYGYGYERRQQQRIEEDSRARGRR